MKIKRIKNYTVIKKNKIIIFTLIVMFFFLNACNRNENNYLKSNMYYMYKVSYLKDSIIINTIEGEKNDLLKLYFYNGEYYDSNNNALFLSTKRNVDFEIVGKRNVKYII